MFTIPKIREISKHLQYPHYWGYEGDYVLSVTSVFTMKHFFHMVVVSMPLAVNESLIFVT